MPHVTNHNAIPLGFTSSTTGASPWSYTSKNSFSSAPGGSTGGANLSSGGASGVGKDVLKNLQDVVWSDDEVRAGFHLLTSASARPSCQCGPIPRIERLHLDAHYAHSRPRLLFRLLIGGSRVSIVYGRVGPLRRQL